MLKDILFIPQQLWAFKKKKYGVWTVCLHPDFMTEKDFEILLDDLLLLKKKVITVDDLNLNATKGRNIFDVIFHYSIILKLKLKILIKNIKIQK